jgi:hypothetical protein
VGCDPFVEGSSRRRSVHRMAGMAWGVGATPITFDYDVVGLPPFREGGEAG